jgi:Anti-sigma factor NepR
MSDQNIPPTAEQRGHARRQRAIGDGLKHLFEDVVDRPTPSYLTQLLEKADRRRTIANDR